MLFDKNECCARPVVCAPADVFTLAAVGLEGIFGSDNALMKPAKSDIVAAFGDLVLTYVEDVQRMTAAEVPNPFGFVCCSPLCSSEFVEGTRPGHGYWDQLLRGCH